MINFTIREGMDLQVGQKVEVYFNIHKGGFSIKSIDKANPNKGRVVAYSGQVELEDCTYHVNENNLKKLLEERRKRVYAVVRGTFKGSTVDTTDREKLSINPYTSPFFTDSKGSRVHESRSALFTGKGVFK
jgi:hypothetical protein